VCDTVGGSAWIGGIMRPTMLSIEERSLRGGHVEAELSGATPVLETEGVSILIPSHQPSRPASLPIGSLTTLHSDEDVDPSLTAPRTRRRRSWLWRVRAGPGAGLCCKNGGNRDSAGRKRTAGRRRSTVHAGPCTSDRVCSIFSDILFASRTLAQRDHFKLRSRFFSLVSAC